MPLFYYLQSLINPMKSKSKGLQKHASKEQSSDNDENPNEFLRRTSGTKPFQLSKIRNQKRSSLEALNIGTSLQLHRNKSQDLEEIGSQEAKAGVLDLMIHKKQLLNNHHNKVLESQRKIIIYSSEGDKLQNLHNRIEVNNKVNQTEQDNIVEPSHPAQNQANPIATQCHARKKSKCQCCLHLNQYLTEAVITKSQHFNSTKEELSLKSKAQQEINALIQLKHVKDKVEKSPFSFTSLKWRTKSEHLQVDKWKEKYGKPDLEQYGHKAGSLNKIIKETHKQRVNRSQQTSGVKQKLKKPTLLHQNLPSLSKLLARKGVIPEPETPLSKNPEQSIIPQPLFLAKYQDSESMLYNFRSTGFKREELIQQQESANLGQRGNLQQVNLQIDLNESSPKLLSARQVQGVDREDPPNNNKQTKEAKISIPAHQKSSRQLQKNKSEKIIRKREDRIRFPFIQGAAAVRNTKQIEQKKPPKAHQTHKIDFSWKEKLSRKVYMAKVMEQIPERWEYGDSRDNSREVDSYIKVKEEEEKLARQQQERLILQQQEKMRIEQEAEQERRERQLLQARQIQQEQSVINICN